jgi:hypothetical protein
MRLCKAALLIAAIAAACCPARALEFRLQDVSAIANIPVAQLKARTVVFSEQPSEKLDDPKSLLIPFEDWVRARPLQQQFLSLFPGFAEPALKGGRKRKLSIYVAEARIRLAGPAPTHDLSRYANLTFFERIDPAVKHRQIDASDAVPNNNREFAHNRRSDRKWCEVAKSICIQSHYKFEGKIPTGIRLVNKLRDEAKKPIPDYIEFQSEIRVHSSQQPEFANVSRLTGIDGSGAEVLEQSIFWVNQVMQFGKLLAVLQQHPNEPDASLATVYLVLAVRNDVLEKQRNYGKAPVLRNLVPAQLLMGKSSFNAGNSISAGLPRYARSRIMALAEIIEPE